jgi:mRNA-degrading endonuclease RelE of RelBE toxin-antitoxin system
MKTEVLVAERVRLYVRSQAPAPRQALHRAVKALAKDQGDIKRLEGKLSGWSRLRVTEHRVLFRETADRGVRKINCVFAEKRSVVYEMFAELLANELLD